jgi:cystathionine beta-lyase
METYDFDKVIDRSNTGALKYEVLQERYGRADLLPLWVADMDFETPRFITDAMRERLEHSLFGYTVEPEDYKPSIIRWIKNLHGWDIKPEWINYIPGIVKGIGMVVNVFTEPGDKVIIQPPVYHPFRLTPQGNNREVVMNPLIENPDGSYSMDFEQLESISPDCKLLILSNPHNPAGIVWDRDTLTRLAEICYRNHLLVVSDEIHAEMALWDNKHIPFASVSDMARDCSITFAAPTKTFNIAGIVSSYAIVPNDSIRRKFYTWLEANELNEPTIFAPIATIAAYNHGDNWRRQMLKYVEANIDFLVEYCEKNIPQIKPIRPQASFLVWLDCRALGLSHDLLIDLFVNKAHLALNDGEMFGIGGEGFMRLNVAEPRSVLVKALNLLKNTVDSYVNK